jgi:pimeloyl-ACP methyl ester carboxylesterase
MIRLFGAFVSLLLSTVSANAESGSHELWRACGGYEPGKSFVETGAPEGAERFIGAYRGKWANQLDHVLIIDRIAAYGTVSAYYAWGRYPYWGIAKDACERHTGTLRSGVVNLRISREKEARYVLSLDGLLAGEYHLRGSITIGLFHRFDPMRSEPPAGKKPPKSLAFPSGYISERITTGLIEDGQTVHLQIIVSKPRGKGPFPLLVFNHGSVGRGQNEAAARAVRVFHPVTQYFLSKGWMVVVPQRRGRGWSDGLHDEGLVNDRSRYSCDPKIAIDGLNAAIEDVDAVMENLLARPEVDAERVVMGGNSRGGGLALAYAGKYPEKVRGVINASGGWHGTVCASFISIHRRLATDAARSSKPTLWLHGGKDTEIDLKSSEAVFEMFRHKGGTGTFVPFPEAGHNLLWENRNWIQPVGQFMAELGFSEFVE